MRRYKTVILILLLPLVLGACGNDAKREERNSTVQNVETIHIDSTLEPDTKQEPVSTISLIPSPDSTLEPDTKQEPEQEPQTSVKPQINSMEKEADVMETNQIYIQVGESTLTAVLEDNESAEALKEFLADGPVTISASNYGGFEKVCSLGTDFPRNDSRTTTHAGDICLYSGDQIVIFYGSNSWAYTRLGKVSDTDEMELETVLGGDETEITLSLET